MERIFKVLKLESGERVEGVELGFADHPGHDPIAPAQPASFVRYVDAGGRVVRMEKHADEATAARWVDELERRVGQ